MRARCKLFANMVWLSDPSPALLAGDSYPALTRPVHATGQFSNIDSTATSTAATQLTYSTRQTSTASSPSNSGSAQERLSSKCSPNVSTKRPLSAEDAAVDKRRRNTLAARKFRQKQQDRVAQLEQALKEVSKERDELKMQVARWEGETVALRTMLADRSRK